MKVENLLSNRGNSIPNQFRLRDDSGNTFFQSYNSIIAKIDNRGKVYLDERYWDYSVTTSKYRAIFLDEKTKETKAKIKSGEYQLANLN